ncbi:MAG TPA: translesion DNA synthesis-associated protein ImuA, partial [Myxococcota bacterium]|nr:translesion DNA synthesis-associated protein ImuA [Myxococcota bacterium]
PSGLSSGYPELDALLNGGWPPGALIEILIDRAGVGELRLMLPTLARLTHEERWLAFVAPPYVPYAPALLRGGVNLDHVLLIHPRQRTDALWAVEQTLRAGTCGAVLAWLHEADTPSLRRLQLAAETGNSLGILFRRTAASEQSSPAAVRLRLAPAHDAARRLSVEVLKRRGGWPTGPIALEVNHALARSPFSRSAARGLHARRSRA